MPTIVSQAVYKMLYIPHLQSLAVIIYLDAIFFNKFILINNNL